MSRVWRVLLLELANRVYPLVEDIQEWIHTLGVPGMKHMLRTPMWIDTNHTSLGPAQGLLSEQADINLRRRTGRLQ